MSESKTVDSSRKIESKQYLSDYFKREQKEHDLTFHEWICEEKKEEIGFKKTCDSTFCRSKHMVGVASH